MKAWMKGLAVNLSASVAKFCLQTILEKVKMKQITH